MKKFISSLLALVMVFSLSVPAFAAENVCAASDDTISVTQKIYFDEITPDPAVNNQDHSAQDKTVLRGSRPKKW